MKTSNETIAKRIVALAHNMVGFVESAAFDCAADISSVDEVKTMWPDVYKADKAFFDGLRKQRCNALRLQEILADRIYESASFMEDIAFDRLYEAGHDMARQFVDFKLPGGEKPTPRRLQLFFSAQLAKAIKAKTARSSVMKETMAQYVKETMEDKQCPKLEWLFD